MKYREREVNKEFYEDCVKNNNGCIKDPVEFFGDCLWYGYGVYGVELFERDGKYFVGFSQGSTCD